MKKRYVVLITLGVLGVLLAVAVTIVQKRYQAAAGRSQIKLPPGPPQDYLLVTDIVDYDDPLRMSGARVLFLDSAGKAVGHITNPRIRFTSSFAFTKKCMWFYNSGFSMAVDPWPGFSGDIFRKATCINLADGKPIDVDLQILYTADGPTVLSTGDKVVFGSNTASSLLLAQDDLSFKLIEIPNRPQGSVTIRVPFNAISFKGRYALFVSEGISTPELMLFEESTMTLEKRRPLEVKASLPRLFIDNKGLLYSFYSVTDIKSSRRADAFLVRLDDQFNQVSSVKLPPELLTLNPIGVYKNTLYFAGEDRKEASIWTYKDGKATRVWKGNERIYKAILKPQQNAIFMLPWKRGGEVMIFSLKELSLKRVQLDAALVDAQ
jgi:hypothetical protein